MTDPRHIAVIDIGKTNAKLAMVDLETLREVAVVTRPNTVIPGPPWPHFDVDGHWAFLIDGLARFHQEHGVDAISVTTHGASVAMLRADGRLAAPILDYEHPGPSDESVTYDALRPDFAVTGSPRLAGGLNVGAQIHWQFEQDAGLRDRTAQIVTYPQYWGHRLTGEVACDVTSIGCHTDLWCPYEGGVSGLVDDMGIAEKLAPVRKPSEVLGPILPDIAAATGLRADTPVAVGIHDSNASLYPHVLSQPGPFSVVSTGTWVVVMTMGGAPVTLDPARDTLVNVNALGDPVPSARFMGGREFDLMLKGQLAEPDETGAMDVIRSGQMLLPAVEPTTGPFARREAHWINGEPPAGSAARMAAVSCYLAMMSATCLELTGATGPTIVEGPFARNWIYKEMLAAATGREVLEAASATGTSVGAALLFGAKGGLGAPGAYQPRLRRDVLGPYADDWRRRAN